MLFGALTIQAEEMRYLTIETTDGTKASLDISSLKLSFNGSTLTTVTQSFPLSNLRKVYFTASNETSTGIEKVAKTTFSYEPTGIYDLQGHKVSKNQMKRGIYIIKTKEETYKLVVR